MTEGPPIHSFLIDKELGGSIEEEKTLEIAQGNKWSIGIDFSRPHLIANSCQYGE